MDGSRGRNEVWPVPGAFLLCVPTRLLLADLTYDIYKLWKILPQLHFLVPISSESMEEAEKEELRVQLKRHHPSSPLPGAKPSKRPKIKVSLISQGDTAGGPCALSQGGTPEGESFVEYLVKVDQLSQAHSLAGSPTSVSVKDTETEMVWGHTWWKVSQQERQHKSSCGAI